VRLTNGPGSDFNPNVSPDGGWIVFQTQTRPRSDQYTIQIMRADGSNRRLLSDTTMVTESPEFSADGTHITYTQTPISKSEWKGLPPREMIRERKKLEHRVTMRLDGSEVRAEAPDTTVCCIRRTANGKVVYFTSTRAGARAVYVRNTAGSGVRRIASATEVPEPEVSPDGRWFAFVRNNGIYVREIVTGAERLLISGQKPRS
jgi:Tol biopolymer transport system component